MAPCSPSYSSRLSLAALPLAAIPLATIILAAIPLALIPLAMSYSPSYSSCLTRHDTRSIEQCCPPLAADDRGDGYDVFALDT
jgi:hypothetical protein